MDRQARIDTSFHDFTMGSTLFASAVNPAAGELTLSKAWTYPTTSSEGVAISWPEVRRILADPAKDFIYVGSKYGITVIDTHGSNNPANHTVVTRYDMASTAVRLPSGDLNDIFLDSTLGILYVAIGGGGFVAIDTKNNKDPADDVLLTNFSFISIPSVGGITGWAYSVYLDPVSHFLYLGTSYQGLLVIDTKGVSDTAQWVYQGRYAAGTSPAISDGWVLHADINHSTGLLYASTNGGLYVLDTKNTDSMADDTLVFNYNSTGSVPGVSNNWNQMSFRDDSNGIIYVSGSYFAAIDTQNTISAADDSELGRYGTGVLSPTFSWSGNGYFDASTKYLYLSTSAGAQIIDTKGTKNTGDDTIVANYNSTSSPAVASDNVLSIFQDTGSGLLFVGTSSGLSVVLPHYPTTGSYTSQLLPISTTPHDTLSWIQSTPISTSVSVQYRGVSDVAQWEDQFDDNLTTEFAGDAYGWGSSFQNATESGGTLKLSNPLPDNYGGGSSVYFWITTGQPDKHFQIGTTLKVRYRVNSNRQRHSTWSDYVYTDDWWDGSGSFVSNQWQTVTVPVLSSKFSKIGFEITWESGTWDNVNDSVEIDWIQITDYGYDAWSTACVTSASCSIDPASLSGKDYLQYRVNLGTTDLNVSPQVSQVSLLSGYGSSKTHELGALLFPGGNELVEFSADVQEPAGTGASFEYSIDNGASWSAMTVPYLFPANTSATNFRWRVTLSTSDPSQTPTVNGAAISSSLENSGYFYKINPGSVDVSNNKIAYVSPGSYTFTVPPGFTQVDVFVLGGGGAGGTCSSAASGSGGGGGGGGYYLTNYSVSAGQTFSVVVGAGAVAGKACANGGSGGTSSFENLAYGGGGAGGTYSSANGAGGAGGVGSGTGGTAWSGGSGGAGGSTWWGGTGGGAACPFANGGDGSATGGGYGPGGGGAGFLATGTPSTGGDGANTVGGLGGCGGGNGGAGRITEATNAVGSQVGFGVTSSGSIIQAGGGFGGGGGGAWGYATHNIGGGGGSGLVWIYLH